MGNYLDVGNDKLTCVSRPRRFGKSYAANVLTLLVHLGYLAYDPKGQTVFIPNEEVRQEFVRAVTTGRHKEVAKLIQNSAL